MLKKVKIFVMSSLNEIILRNRVMNEELNEDWIGLSAEIQVSLYFSKKICITYLCARGPLFVLGFSISLVGPYIVF